MSDVRNNRLFILLSLLDIVASLCVAKVSILLQSLSRCL